MRRTLRFIADPPLGFRVFVLALLWGLLFIVGTANGQTVETDTARVRIVRDSLLRADSVRHAERAARMAEIDSLMRKTDSLLRVTSDSARSVPTIWTIELHSGGAARRATKVYAAGITTALVVNYAAGIDRDPGGYRDSWTTPDKFYHFQSAYFLADFAMGQSVPKRWAFLLTCGLAGVGWEVSQRGFISGKDIAADCAGAGAALVMRTLAEKAAR